MGNDIRLEKISYRAWQKMFGKSIRHHAPGMLKSLRISAEILRTLIPELSN